MNLLVDPRGNVRCLYGETIDLKALGELTICRVSSVEPDRSGRWWADLTVVAGPRLGPYLKRSQALEAETAWIDRLLFTGKD